MYIYIYIYLHYLALDLTFQCMIVCMFKGVFNKKSGFADQLHVVYGFIGVVLKVTSLFIVS